MSESKKDLTPNTSKPKASSKPQADDKLKGNNEMVLKGMLTKDKPKITF